MKRIGHEVWYHGDIVLVDPADGLWYILGRADLLIKTSGHRIESAEIECAITSHRAGMPDKIKGESVTAYVVLKNGFPQSKIKVLKDEIVKIVENSVGRFACPKNIVFVEDLPRTRTGKIVRRTIKAKALGEKLDSQDLSAIENPESLENIVSSFDSISSSEI